MDNQQIGQIGEQYALQYLRSQGYSIQEVNYRTKFGEIDIIAKKSQLNKIYFVEVKTRMSIQKGLPYEAVDRRKLAHIKRVAQYYLLKNKITKCKLSIVVIGIILNSNFSLKTLKLYEL